MENKDAAQKTTLAKSTLPYGIIFGIILFLEFILSYVFELNSAENKTVGVIMSLLNYIILPVLFIVLACNNFKNKINGGYITFGQTLKGGVAVCVMAALISSVTTSVFYLVIPDAKEQILEQTKLSLASQPNMNAEAMKMALKMTEVFMQPYVLIPFSIIIFAFMGLLLSLLIGAIIKKENPYGDYTPNDNTGDEQ